MSMPMPMPVPMPMPMSMPMPHALSSEQVIVALVFVFVFFIAGAVNLSKRTSNVEVRPLHFRVLFCPNAKCAQSSPSSPLVDSFFPL